MKIVIGFLGTIFFLELDILDESRKERGVLSCNFYLLKEGCCLVCD
jgi:hypothetical protein